MGQRVVRRLRGLITRLRACDAWLRGPPPALPFLVLLGAWVALNVADVTSTLVVLQCGGPCGREGNPIPLALLAQGGTRALLLNKGLTTMAAVGLMAVGWRHMPRGVFWLVAAFNVGMTCVVANNLFWLAVR